MSPLLEVRDLKVAYGKIMAVKGISFTVDEGDVVSLIGTNGAGKTTTLRTISGLIRPAGGQIRYQGKDISSVPAHDIVGLGLAHSPEGRRIFPRMTVEENLLLGAYGRRDGDVSKDLKAAYELFPILGERSKQPPQSDGVARRLLGERSQRHELQMKGAEGEVAVALPALEDPHERDRHLAARLIPLASVGPRLLRARPRRRPCPTRAGRCPRHVLLLFLLSSRLRNQRDLRLHRHSLLSLYYPHTQENNYTYGEGIP